MTKQLQEHRKALQSIKKRLNGNASLKTDEGRQYIRCLTILVSTVMQIEEKQGMKKDASQRPQ